MVPTFSGGSRDLAAPPTKIQATRPMESQKQSGWRTDAQSDRDYDSLTGKQQSAVDTLVKHGDADDMVMVDIADAAGVTESYVHYVQDNFPHIISERKRLQNTRVAADGGERAFTISLTESDAWKAIRSLPEDLSTEIFQQVHEQE